MSRARQARPEPFSVDGWREVPEHLGVGAITAFARRYLWNAPIHYPEYAAARVVKSLEPLHPEARVLLLAALTTSARHAA